MQVASVPLGLVATQAQLISRSTRSAKLPFFQKAAAIVVIVDFARIQGYEERKEGAYARDAVNIRANAPAPVLSKSSVQKGGRRGVFFGNLRYIIICALVKCISLTTPIH